MLQQNAVPHDGGESRAILGARRDHVRRNLPQTFRSGTDPRCGSMRTQLMNAKPSRSAPSAQGYDGRSDQHAERGTHWQIRARSVQCQRQGDPDAPGRRRKSFSVRDWVAGDCQPGSLLFLSARYVDMSVLSQLLTLWLDTAINALMTGRRTHDLKLWFLIDELESLAPAAIAGREGAAKDGAQFRRRHRYRCAHLR